MQSVTVTPPIAGLAYSHVLPEGWHQVPLPEQQYDFSQPVFMPLAVNMAPYAAVVFAVAARPAFSDGSVYDWLLYMCRKEEFEIQSAMPVRIAGRDAVESLALQHSDGGPMRMRMIMFEDGGRIFSMSCMAPDPIWGSLEDTFQQIVDSFRLQDSRGATVALVPGQTPPTAEAAASLKDFRLASDAGSLSLDHPINRHFLENGIGFVPRVVQINSEECYARLGISSIRALMNVPFGWHAIDDGARTLVFDPSNDVQINFSLRDLSQTSLDEVAGAIVANAAESSPAVEHLRLELGGMPALSLRGLTVDGETLDQVFLYPDYPPRDHHRIEARVTSRPEAIVKALDMVEIMLRDIEFV